MSLLVQAPLSRDGEYRREMGGGAQVRRHFAQFEAVVRYDDTVANHLAAEVRARQCKKGRACSVIAERVDYPTDHGELRYPLRGITSVRVDEAIVL